MFGRAFRRHLLFSRWPSLLGTAGLRLSKAELLYNSYYWMLEFAKLRGLKHGYDAGIEQQAFKIIEQADSELDWTIIEKVDLSRGEGT